MLWRGRKGQVTVPSVVCDQVSIIISSQCWLFFFCQFALSIRDSLWKKCSCFPPCCLRTPTVTDCLGQHWTVTVVMLHSELTVQLRNYMAKWSDIVHLKNMVACMGRYGALCFLDTVGCRWTVGSKKSVVFWGDFNLCTVSSECNMTTVTVQCWPRQSVTVGVDLSFWSFLTFSTMV